MSESRDRMVDASIEWALLRNGNRPMELEEIRDAIRGFGPSDFAQVATIAAAESDGDRRLPVHPLPDRQETPT